MYLNQSIKKASTPKDILKGWGNLVFAEILSLLVNLFTVNFMNNSTILRGIVGIFTMAILVCIVGNYTYNVAKRDKTSERTFKTPHREYKHILLAVTTSAPLVLQWLVLLIYRVQNLNPTFLNTKVSLLAVYKILNAYFLPWINVFNLEPILTDLSVMAMVTMFAFTIVPAITIVVVYPIVYNSIDIQKILMYDKE